MIGVSCLTTTVSNPTGGTYDVCGGGVTSVTAGTSISGGGATNLCTSGRSGCDLGFEIGTPGAGGNVYRTAAITMCNVFLRNVNNVDSFGIFAQSVGTNLVSVKEFGTLGNCP